MSRISRSARRMIDWLGPARAQFIFFLLALTGLFSLMLNAVQPRQDWVFAVQSGLLALFLVGASIAVLTRFSGPQRRQMAVMIVPAVGALSLGLFFPNLMMFFLPIAVGWVLILALTGGGRVRREYQLAIRALRRDDYDEAIRVMTDVIKAEPTNADHRRFRAELNRIAGKIKKARADYEKVIELTPESGVGYNGLAEVYLQDGEYEQALPYARKALELEPDQWVAAYNLGMIEERLEHSSEALQHLAQALKSGIPDSRHRLLTYLWTARAHYRLGAQAEAEAALQGMKRERTGLREWKTIFESEQAAVLRNVLQADVELAGRLVEGEDSLEALARPQGVNVSEA